MPAKTISSAPVAAPSVSVAMPATREISMLSVFALPHTSSSVRPIGFSRSQRISASSARGSSSRSAPIWPATWSPSSMAAAIGAITGAVIVIGQRITDWLTAALALVTSAAVALQEAPGTDRRARRGVDRPVRPPVAALKGRCHGRSNPALAVRRRRAARLVAEARREPPREQLRRRGQASQRHPRAARAAAGSQRARLPAQRLQA